MLWDPFFSDRTIEWDEVPVCFLLTLPISLVCLLPFYGMLKLFQIFKLKQIPYDGWYLQAFACIVYSILILYFQGKYTDLVNWYLGYYPIGIAYFAWYNWLKLNNRIKV